MTDRRLFAIPFAILVTAHLLLGCQRREAEPPPTAPNPPTAADSPAPGTVTAAVKGALAVSDPLARAATLSAVLQGLGPDAVGEVVDAFDTVTWSVRDTLGVELALLVEWWGRLDAPSAYQWLAVRQWIGNPVLTRAVIRAWARQDPAAARETVESTAGRDRGRLIAALAEGWFDADRKGVEDYLVALPPGAERQLAIAGLARQRVLRDGIEPTLRWAEALPDAAPGRFKLQAYRRVAGAVAEVDPVRAAAWVELQLEGELWDGLARRVAVRWAGQDGQAALTWLLSLPPEKLGTAVQEAYRVWLDRDGEGAHAWLDAAQANPATAPAVGIYALGVAREDPSAALAWAAKVADEPLRHRTLVQIGRTWMARDPEAARAWLAESELTPTERERVLVPTLNRPQEQEGAGTTEQDG